MRKRNTIFVLILCLALILSGCSKGADKKPAELPTLGDNTETVQPDAGTQEPAKIIEQSAKAILTGLPLESGDAGARPIAVVIDNMASARPQSGLQSADIVYEMPAEGGITRYLAIYQSQTSEKIGPVRSARSYFLDKAMEFNAVFIHCGGSPEALKDIDILKLDTLNELKGEKNFWRARDRKAPHNLYTSTKLTREVMETKKTAGKKWSYSMSFSEDFLVLDGKTTNKIIIDYKNNYKAGYEYDEKQKLYYRTVNGVRLRDKDTNTEITAVNIIVEKVSAKVVDDVGRLNLSNTGKGRGYLVTGGKLIEIEWNKTSREAKTIYTDLKGNAIKLNKGNTWVQVVPESGTIEIKE